MPIRLFEDGDILDAADVNTYFMGQVLVIFDSANQRDASFGAGLSPLSEGRICYVKDEDTIYIYVVTAGVGAWTPQLANIANGVITSAKLASNIDLSGTTEIDEILETVVINTSALTGTVPIYAKSGSVQYFTAAAQSANWIWNITGEATGAATTLTSMMDAGQSITFALFVKNGATAYYPTSITVDGYVPASFRWFGGTTITAGNVNSVDCYTVTVIKTTSTLFEVFASQSKFA